MRFIIHVLIFVFLTITTQIGGLIYLLSVLIINKKKNNRRIKRIGIFVLLYLFTTFLIVPFLAPFFGRERVKESQIIEAHTFFTKLMNRNYVKPKLNRALTNISKQLNKKHKGIKLIYLDANFPFINKFPLLPHLSHNDGKKIDLSFVYQMKEKITDKKASISGYGVFEEPKNREVKQYQICKNKGYWQYDFTKYFTFGTTNKDIVFSKESTKNLILSIIKEKEIEKLFIEPHLVKRMGLNSSKIRFHGCRAVRHDDHIHIQIK